MQRPHGKRHKGRCLTLIVLEDIRGKASLVSHVGGVFSVLGFDNIFQVVVHLNTATEIHNEIMTLMTTYMYIYSH